MERLRSGATAILLVGLVLSRGPASAAPKARPTQPKPAPSGAAAASAASEAQVSPEEDKRRKAWGDSLAKKEAPKKGCFKVDYPNTEWEGVQCVPSPQIPLVPRRGPRPDTIGNANDVAAAAPSGFISRAIGHFDNVTNVTSESGPIGNAGPSIANAYTLQINTDNFTSTVCSGSPNASCKGWQQFVFANNGTSGAIYIQYWIIHYDANCPAGQSWTQFPYNGGIYCYKNNSAGATAVPNQPISNMGKWTFSGAVSSTGDSVTLSTGTSAYTQSGDNAVNASSGWTVAEFNIFGDGGNSAGGGMATFNSGASVVTRTEILYGGTAAPNCSSQGFTGETNNLSFGPTAPAATTPGPSVIFSESTAGGATSNCAAASTIGDTHLRTFNGLFYDFQASGDFVLAQVDPGFAVQTRQVSGAPTWPNATVNKAVAARFGTTQVAICLGAPGTDQPSTVHVDGKLTAVNDGQTLGLDGEVAIQRKGNVYQITSGDGNSVRAIVNSTWINVDVGLGRWPVPVHGLIANANGNVNQIETRDHFVLTNAFNFDELYQRFADSWRVAPAESMLSVCGGREIERAAPKQAFFAGDLEPAVRAKAFAVCNAAGVKPGTLLDACTLDVAVIGVDAAAKAFVDAIPPAAVGTVVGGHGGGAGGVGGILGNWWWLLLLLLVIIVIGWLLLRRKP